MRRRVGRIVMEQQMQLTENEIKWLAGHPEALRLAADYHDLKAVEADASDFGECVPAHVARQAELKAEAVRLEKEWGI